MPDSKCSACGKAISPSTDVCPHCGFGPPRKSYLVIFAGIAIALGAAGGAVYLMRNSIGASVAETPVVATPQLTSPKSRYDPAVIRANVVANLLRKTMRSPDDFRLETVQVMPDHDALCFTYHARNALGEIVLSQAVLAPNGITLRTEEMHEFAALWKAECDGRTGEDIRSQIVWDLE